MRYRLWNISQCTNTAPSVTPTCSPPQNQRRKVAPASRATATVTTTANPAIPSSELGNPNTSACGLVITEPQDRIGLMLHDGTYAGSRSNASFSTVRTADAASPMIPPISRIHGSDLPERGIDARRQVRHRLRLQ